MFCMEFSSTPNTSVQRCLNPIFQNQHLLFALPPLFEEYLNHQLRINKMVKC